MANPYSQYTGSRISAVPSGYLTAATAAAESVRKSGERAGDMIGAGIARYYKGKQQDADDEALGQFIGAMSVPSVEELNRTWQQSAKEENEKRLRGEPFDRDKVVADFDAWEKAKDTPPTAADKMEKLEAGIKAFIDERDAMSPEAFREGLNIYFAQKKNLVAEEQFEAQLKKPEGAAASALMEKVGLLDGIAGDMGWSEKELAEAKAQVVGAAKSGEGTPAQLQAFEAIQNLGWYKELDPAQRKVIDQRLFKVEDPDSAVARKKDEETDKANREAFVALLQEQGRLPQGVIDKFALAGSFAAMDTMFDNLTDEQKGKMPADARTWAAIRSGFPANTPADEIEKYRRIHFGLEDRESRTPAQKEMEAFALINNDPTKTQEEKIRAGYMYGVYSGPETARRYYEAWEKKNPDASEEVKDDKRALLNLPTGVEAEHAKVKLELDQKRLEDAKRVEDAIASGGSGVQVMAIPGTNSHKFVKMPTQDHWTLINTGTGKAEDKPISDDQAIEWNKWLEDAGIAYRWTPDNSAAGWSYGSMGGFNMNREFLDDKKGSTKYPRRPHPGAIVAADGKSATIGVNTFTNESRFQDPKDGKWKILIIEDGKVFIQQDTDQGDK